MKPLIPVTPGARLALGIAFFIVFVTGWSVATFGGFVSKTFLADPLTMVRSGYTLLATRGFGWSNGEMTRMNTLHPLVFAKFKHWMAELPGRDAKKRHRDELQATAVEAVVKNAFLNWNVTSLCRRCRHRRKQLAI